MLSEEQVLRWNRGTHTGKGKSVFCKQMKQFVEWLENAEEGKYSSPLTSQSEVLGKDFASGFL